MVELGKHFILENKINYWIIKMKKHYINILLFVIFQFFIISIFYPSIFAENSKEMETTGLNSFVLSVDEQKQLMTEANDGDANAAIRLSQYYEFIENNRSESIKWLRISAKNGQIIAQYNLGYLLFHDKDEATQKEAMYWLYEAAEHGIIDAYTVIAGAFEDGENVGKNLETAKSWYTKAAFNGDTQAIKKMIEFCSEGKGGAKDIKTAYSWILFGESLIDPESVNGLYIKSKKIKFQKLLTPNELKAANDELKIKK